MSDYQVVSSENNNEQLHDNSNEVVQQQQPATSEGNSGGVLANPQVQQGLEAFKATGNFQYDYIDFSSKQPIPDNFIKVACCAFRFDNLEMPTCLGFKSGCQVCCFQCTSYACKPITGNNNVCLICSDDIFEIVNFAPTLYCYRQCCCIEVVMQLPELEGYVEMPNVAKSGNDNFATADPAFVYPCSANCCSIDSIYMKYPDCIGCFSRGHCCCVEGSSTSCKPLFLNEGRSNQNLLCLVGKGHRYCVPFKFGCWSEGQCCCRDSRAAFPCTPEVPCVLTYCFVTLCVNFVVDVKVAAPLSDITASAKDKPLPAIITSTTEQLQAASESAAAKVNTA
mmetsp:Transcript_23583/g.18031  ORF Transcript_23583/g.18031 Transcript_23583/m.18031 type:complete len:337 (-) Transcript_23583:335-1345(-)